LLIVEYLVCNKNSRDFGVLSGQVECVTRILMDDRFKITFYNKKVKWTKKQLKIYQPKTTGFVKEKNLLQFFGKNPKKNCNKLFYKAR